MTTTSPTTLRHSAPPSHITSMREFENAFKHALTEQGISILDAPVDYSRTIDLYARLHVGVLN